MSTKSKYLIVFISLTVGLLHFIISPKYHGWCETFIRGYLIDIVLPLNMYLLLQIFLRNRTTVLLSRVIGASFTFVFGLTVEILQLNNIHVFGTTYDVIDILMYAIGVSLGILIDFMVIAKWENGGE